MQINSCFFNLIFCYLDILHQNCIHAVLTIVQLMSGHCEINIYFNDLFIQSSYTIKLLPLSLSRCLPFSLTHSSFKNLFRGVVLFAMVVGRLPFDVEQKKPVNNQHRRELFLEETKRGIKTKRHQAYIGGTSYCNK